MERRRALRTFSGEVKPESVVRDPSMEGRNGAGPVLVEIHDDASSAAVGRASTRSSSLHPGGHDEVSSTDLPTENGPRAHCCPRGTVTAAAAVCSLRVCRNVTVGSPAGP